MKDLFEERYRATPAALDRESIIEHLLDVVEDGSMHDCVFNKCEAMIKQYKISANPDWDLSDILDTFTTKQLRELLQYVMDNCKNEALREDDILDDYEDGVVENVEISEVQRLALQELDSCLEYGEITAERYGLAYQIQWDINFEDVLLFINGIDAELEDIKHVEYGDCDETEFDGCYSVTFHNGDVKRYGWHDFDMTGSLTCIDCNESLARSDAGSHAVLESVESTIEDYKNQVELDAETSLTSNLSIRAGKKAARVDTIYIQFDPGFDETPRLVGYAHFDDGGYDHQDLSAADISNYDLGKYMNGTEVTDLEGMLRDNPSILFESVACLTEDRATRSVSEELYNVYNTALDTMLSGANADLPKNIKKAFGALGGSAFFKSVKPHFISGDGYLPHEGNDRGYSINFMISDERDVRRLAQDITMAYYRTKLNGELYTTSKLMKLVLNHDTVELTENIPGAGAYQKNKSEDYDRVDARDFVKHPMNYDVTSNLDFEVPEDVKVYAHRGPGKQSEFYIIIGDTYVRHSFNNLKTVEKYLRRKKLVKEVISEGFNPGDVVYVTVANRQGRVKRMINSDVVEVELHDNGVYPARIDRYYAQDVELLSGDEDLYEDAEMETYTTSFCFGDYCKSFRECQDYFGYHADEYGLTITCTQIDDEHCTIEIVGPSKAVRQYKDDFELDEQDAADAERTMRAASLHEDAAPSTITWEDLRDYKYSFTMQARNSPNSTWGDDCRRVAAQCGCIGLYYHNKFGREVNKLLCKSEAEHKELISRLEADKMLRGYAVVSNLYPFDISDVEAELQKKFQTEVDNYKEVNPPRGRNKKIFSARVVQLLLKRLPGVYVYCGQDMADSIDLRIPYDPQIFAE